MLGQSRVMERLVGLGAGGDQLDDAYEAYWLQRAEIEKRKKRAKSALDLLSKRDFDALDVLGREFTDAVAAGAAESHQTIEARIAAQNGLLAELEAQLAEPPQIPPRAMIPSDIDVPRDEHIRIAGAVDQLGERVPRGFLSVLTDKAIEIPKDQSGRLQLARWLTDVEGKAGQLAARVLANRVWHHLFGRGIVRTVDNFGCTGEAPTHPELLDSLAHALIESGWSVKDLVRRIAVSRTFAMSSRHDESGQLLDPENHLLWRARRRRLDAESLRDAMLLAAGTLDLEPVDSSVSYLGDQATAVGENKVRRRTDFLCRSIYLPVIRNDLPELFQVFNFADPHVTTGARPQTLVPTQGLFVFNDQTVIDAADATAQRLLADEASVPENLRIDRLFERILNVAPTDEERRLLRTFVHSTTDLRAGEGDAQAEFRAWSMACHALFSSSRFQFLE